MSQSSQIPFVTQLQEKTSLSTPNLRAWSYVLSAPEETEVGVVLVDGLARIPNKFAVAFSRKMATRPQR